MIRRLATVAMQFFAVFLNIISGKNCFVGLDLTFFLRRLLAYYAT